MTYYEMLLAVGAALDALTSATDDLTNNDEERAIRAIHNAADLLTPISATLLAIHNAGEADELHKRLTH